MRFLHKTNFLNKTYKKNYFLIFANKEYNIIIHTFYLNKNHLFIKISSFYIT